MREEKVSAGGVLAATLFALIGTVGYYFTSDRLTNCPVWVWLIAFAAALLTLSAAVVNFDPRRLIR